MPTQDGLVQKDKIGTSNHYWAFPSESAKLREKCLSSLGKEVEQLEARSVELDLQIAVAEADRKDTVRRSPIHWCMPRPQSDVDH